MECYSGGSIFGAIFGTIVVIALLGVLALWIYKKYYLKHQKDTKLVPDDDPENAKHEFAFDNLAFKGEGNKSLPLNANWTSPKHHVTNDKRKPLDDSYAGMPAPRMVSLKGSDFTGLGIECYGGLKDGIYVKKVAPQGPACGHINIGDRIMSLTIDFRHIVQEDAMTILSYASPYNVQLELVNGNNNKLRSSSGSSRSGAETASPKPGRQSPLVHPLARSSSQSDLNTIERNSRKKLFHNNEDKDYPTLKMDQKEAAAASDTKIEIIQENEKKSPSLMQQFRMQIAKIEEKFQTRSHDKSNKVQDATASMEEGKVDMMKKEDEIMTETEAQPQSTPKKGLKFGIRVFPPNVNEKLFGKSRGKSISPTEQMMEAPKAQDDVKPCAVVDEIDGSKIKTEVTIECENNFNRQGSITSSGIKRDINGIPQELPEFMVNAANAAKDGREEMRKSKGKAPRPPMVMVDLDASTETIDTNLNTTVDSSSESIANMNANNTNNANMEIEDELDRITEKYLNQSKDKLNFSDNFNSTAGSDKFKDIIKTTCDDDIENNDEVKLRPSNSSTPKCDRKQEVALDLNSSFTLDSSDLDLPNYGNNNHQLNSSDITVHQTENNGDEVTNDDSARRAASMGDLSLMLKKSLAEKDGNNIERAQSLDITDNGLMSKQSLALGLSKPTTDLTVINGDDKENGYELDTNIPDDLKVIRYPFGEPKSDVLKTILGGTSNAPKIEKMEVDATAPSIVVMTNGNDEATVDENVPMTINRSVVTIENNKNAADMEVLSLDVMEQPVSLTLINNTIVNNNNNRNNNINNNSDDPNHMSPVFSSDNFGVNSIKISSSAVDVVPIIKNDGFFVKDNVVTITTTDSQPSSIQFIDDVKLDFNMQVLDDFEKEEKAAMMMMMMMKEDFKPKIVEAETKEKHNGLDAEINNNISKTTIMSMNTPDHISNQQQMNRFLTEIVFKGDDSAIEDMTTSEETTLTSSTVSNASSESSSPNVMTSTKTLTLTNVPLSTANFIKHERKHIEKNFIPQQKSEIKFTTSVYDNHQQQQTNNHKEPIKRLSQIEQIRQNFEKSAENAANPHPIPIPVARKSSGGLSSSSPNNKTPSKIPVFNKKTSPTDKRTRTTSSSNSSNKMSSSSDSVG